MVVSPPLPWLHFIRSLFVCVCVQGVFDHRIKTWQKWQDSQLLLQKKREAEAKLQYINKPDKLQQAKDEIKEVRRHLGRVASRALEWRQPHELRRPLGKCPAHCLPP